MQVKIFIPTQIKDNKVSAYIDSVMHKLTKVFYGATLYTNVRGYWFNPDTDLTEIDFINVIEIFVHHECFNEHKKIFYGLLECIKTDLEQKTLAYSIDNSMFFI